MWKNKSLSLSPISKKNFFLNFFKGWEDYPNSRPHLAIRDTKKRVHTCTGGTIYSVPQSRKSKYVNKRVASYLHLTVYECNYIHPQCSVFQEMVFCCYSQYCLYMQVKDFSWCSMKEARIWPKAEENNNWLCWAYADIVCLYFILNNFNNFSGIILIKYNFCLSDCQAWPQVRYNFNFF